MKQKKAVALRFKPEDNAPKAIALGKGEIAEKILAIAAQKGVPVVVKPELVDKLINLELNQEIPVELYEIIAEILAYIYRLEDSCKNKKIN
jgi:flagellar biosynthesis protein